jgi:trigger factor
MKVSVESLNDCRRVVSISVPADDIRGDYDIIVGSFVKGAKVPGFRQGRAPQELIEKRYSKAIEEEARERLIPKFYNKALEQEKLAALVLVGVTEVEFARDSGLNFKIELDVAPEFKLPKYKKISLKRNSTDVSDADVEEMFNDLLKRYARYEDSTDKPVVSGDMVQIDYSATVDGKPLAEVEAGAADIADGEGFWLPTDGVELVPGMNEALAGASIGDEITLDVEFPEDYRIKSIVGLKAKYAIKVKAVRALTMPELNEEFLKQLGVESEDELRSRIRENLEVTSKNDETTRLKDEIAKHLIEKAKFEAPQSLVEREAYAAMQDARKRFKQKNDNDFDWNEYESSIFASMLKQADDSIKLSFIVNAICEEESLEVTEEDLEKHLEGLSQHYGMTPEAVRTELEKQDRDLSKLRNNLLVAKAFDLMLDNAKIKE